MKRLLTLFLALAMLLSIAVPAMAAEKPLGANHKIVEVEGGLNPGAYLVNDTWDTYTQSNQNNKGYVSNRLITTSYSWNKEWESNPLYGNFNGTGGYVFDPDSLPGLRWHEDGYPIRATYRTPIEHLGEMRYLAEKYPDITRLIYLGQTNGISPNATNPSDFNPYPEYSVPLYAIEISNKPGVMDGRPATLHQAGNHAGEIDANEYCGNLMWYLVTQYGKNDEVTELVDTTRIYLLPYTNGDGNHISFRAASGNRRTNARGVDLNRNWAYRWGSNNGSSSNPGTGGNYRGTAPNSEPETTAITSLYRTDNVLSSVSGHTSGQIVIFAWAFVNNPKNGHPELYKLARQQTDINGYTAQNGNVMYAQSGEINDYLWGSMRAMGFTYEYMQTQTGAYLGSSNGPATAEASRGQPYLLGNFLSPLGQPVMTMIAGNYRGGSDVVSNSTPIADLTAQLAFLDPEEFHAGYQQLQAGEGTNVLPAPGRRMLTLAMVEAELAKRPGFVKDKIFMSHVATNDANATAIVNLLNAEGAKGWIVVNTSASSSGGVYQHYNPSAAYGPSGSNLIVTAVTKGYAGTIYDHYLADPTTTVTFKADRTDLLSVENSWQRNKPAYMRNMQIAREYANQVKGTVKDENGNNLDATLEAALVIEGKIVQLTSNQGSNPTRERPYEDQWKEVQRVRYDVNEDTTDNGTYTWFMLPSKQSEYADKGWTVTASAPGRYTQTRNLKFATDTAIAVQRGQNPTIFADPLYQQVVTGIDFTLVKAIDAALAENKVEFTTFAKDGTAADQLGVYVLVNGVAADVTSLGNGKYEAAIPASYENISVGFTGAAPVVFGEIKAEDGIALVDATTAVADLELTTNANLLKSGDYFNVNTAFVKSVPTNVVKVTYSFNPDLFEYRGNKFAEAGLTVLNVAQNDGNVEFTLMKNDGSYGFKEFYWYNAELVSTDLGLVNQVETDYSVLFSAKEDVAFEDGFETITAVASYVVEEDGNKVVKTSNVAMATFTTGQEPTPERFDLIFLSNIIDAFNISIGDLNWYTKYIFWDFNGNGVIDIADIAYVAVRIK